MRDFWGDFKDGLGILLGFVFLLALFVAFVVGLVLLVHWAWSLA